MGRVLFSLAIVLFSTSLALAANIDQKTFDLVRAMIVGKPIPITHEAGTASVTVARLDGVPVLTSSAVSMRLDLDKAEQLPATVDEQLFVFSNCGENDLPFNRSVVAETTRQVALTLNTAIRTTEVTKISASFAAAPFNLSTDITTTHEWSASVNDQQTLTVKTTVTDVQNRIIKPMKALYLKFRAVKGTLKVPARGTIVLNGWVDVGVTGTFTWRSGPFPPIPIDRNVRLPIKTILPVTDGRTVAIEGFIAGENFTSVEFRGVEIDLTKQSSLCAISHNSLQPLSSGDVAATRPLFQ